VLAGHADTGSQTFLAVPLDTAHVLAMSIWLGGLVALIVGALGGTFSGSLRRAIVAFSQLALASVIVLVVSGLFASWRQVGFTIKGYTSTSYGNILFVKLAIVAALVAVAAVSRSIVHKRQVVPLGAPDTVIATIDERTVSGLRRSVGLEVALGLAVLITTALLVNAQPAKSALAPKLFSTEVKVPTQTTTMLIDVIVDPAKAGPNTIHIYTLSQDGRAFPVDSISATVALLSQGVEPYDAKLQRAGPNHYLVSGLLITPAGKWTLQIHATRGEFTDIAAPPIQVPIR
jgi:copper transport protein